MKIDKEEVLAKYFPKALEKLKELLRIKSYAQPATKDAPFGEGTKQALDYAINLAKELGFEAHQDSQNRYGFFDYGTGDKTFIILCHLDVVPPGNLEEWITDPFNPIEKDNKLIARGVFDDKGPTMMNIYALKYLKDHNFEPDYKIRLVFGLAEETTWQSIRAYLEDYGNADIGYTPDGEFPVIYAEKWVANLDYSSTRTIDYELVGGQATNVVNDLVTYKGPLIDQVVEILNEHNVNTAVNDGTLTIYGKSAHGSLPFLGVNAATWAGYALNIAGLKDPIIEFLNKLHLNFDGTNFLKDLTDETGSLSQNLGIIDVRKNHQKISINYRIPVFSDVEKDLIEPMTSQAKEYGLSVAIDKVDKSVYVPKDSALIKKMMKAYQTVTGDLESQPLAIGGGTYAKTMPNVVAFGGEFDMSESSMHGYNEYTKIDDLKKMLLIYVEAISLLTKEE